MNCLSFMLLEVGLLEAKRLPQKLKRCPTTMIESLVYYKTALVDSLMNLSICTNVTPGKKLTPRS